MGWNGGKGASDGGSVGVDRSDCALYPTYTHSGVAMVVFTFQVIPGYAGYNGVIHPELQLATRWKGAGCWLSAALR
jgi:hypothetical protein